ncbi:hypothetical protein B6D52_00380 [Candidatus Parcubacteria bacterium 4484_255]|nr:MAG: hypothetical protein B6D52_00380 [Candidatus Parcubacteria bacterium 4484_255]
MHHVYILQSTKDNSLYTSITTNLKQRIKNHNSGQIKSTSNKKPYKLIWGIAYLLVKLMRINLKNILKVDQELLFLKNI